MRITLFFLTLTACSGDYFVGFPDGGPEADSGSESSTDGDSSSGDSASDGSSTKDSPSSDSAIVDSGTDAEQCIQTYDWCNWDLDAQMFGTKCCTKKCAMNQQQQWKCTP